MSQQSKTEAQFHRITNKMVSAIAEVVQENPWEDAQRPYESRRMFHERIADKFGRAVARKLKRKDVVCWAMYGGEEKWKYAIKTGPHVLFVDQPQKEADPVNV